KLDDAALVALALALDGLGRGSEALKVLEDHYRKNGISSLDALGVLGGRYKRQWLAGRVAEDLKRARARSMTRGSRARWRGRITPRPPITPSILPFSISWPRPRLTACRRRCATWLSRRSNTAPPPRKITGGWRPRRKPP